MKEGGGETAKMNGISKSNGSSSEGAQKSTWGTMRIKRLSWLFIVVILTVGIESAVNANFVDYTTVANGTYPSLNLGGTTVTGSSNITSADFAGFRGLGVVGGGNDVSLDIGETMTIDFGQVVSNVLFTLVDISPPGNVTFSFEAFNGLSSLGSFDFPAATMAPETYDLSALTGGQNMSRFTVSVGSPSAPFGLQIQSVSFQAIPEPGTLTLAGLSLLAIGMVLKRRS
jgi:hypothetical protein